MEGGGISGKDQAMAWRKISPGIFDLDPGIRYGLQYQAIFDYLDGHVSVGIEAQTDVIAVTHKIRDHLDLPA